MNAAAPPICTLGTPISTDRVTEFEFWRLPELLDAGAPCILLDSALNDGGLGRFSFFAARPVAQLIAHRLPNTRSTVGLGISARMELKQSRQADGSPASETSPRLWEEDPLVALDRIRNEYWPAAPIDADSPPFTGGLIGAVGYETGHCLEDLPDRAHDDLQLPDLAFLVVDEVLVWDHQRSELTLWITGRGRDSAEARSDAESRTTAAVEFWADKLAARPETAGAEQATPCEDATDSTPTVRAHFDGPQYRAAVQKCREHILAGDVFEVCLTHRLEVDQPGPSWEIYSELRSVNPAPFASYLQFPDFQVVSASPERFLRLDRQGVAESRPIKGTRPRGRDATEDARLRNDLDTSAKDRSENLMIVDLVRSDLGKVAEIGSVEVPELLKIEEYATVFQLVSTVRAQLRPDCNAIDLLRAGFPGGSMTGAPKIEAMKIIDSIEPVTRGIYSGAIGYLDRSGAMDLSIVIRTLVCRDGRCTFGVGGAVIADSDPEAEYRETWDKARALVTALGNVERRNRS